MSVINRHNGFGKPFYKKVAAQTFWKKYLITNFLEKSLITSLFKKGLSENPKQRRGQAAQRLVINRRNGFDTITAFKALGGVIVT